MKAARAGIAVVTLADAASVNQWTALPRVKRVVTRRHIAHSGSRLGSRALGLGLDALVVAVRATLTSSRHETFLATNPWIGLFIRLFSRRSMIVTGLYAEPGTRHWRLFRRFIGNATLITLSNIEAENWRASGGKAFFVRYGNSFPYAQASVARSDGRYRIFVGGSSDRDMSQLETLERSILSEGLDVDLVVAIGGPESQRRSGAATVTHVGQVDQPAFGELMATSDVTFLPLVEKERAAGHMILVGSLQVGTPVVVLGGGGMDGYIDGRMVRRIGPSSPHSALMGLRGNLPNRSDTSAFWADRFSRDAYLSAIGNAVDQAAAADIDTKPAQARDSR